ncbi:MAG: thioester reductase domain-containing protein [Planctomycetota bacterium]|mgnify:CR=1 FL=1
MPLSSLPTPAARAAAPSVSVIDYLEHWVALQPDRLLFSFLDQDGNERDRYSYLAFHERTRHLAANLAGEFGLKRGDRALLVYPPGLELIVAFFACARIGVIPVPVYPPTPMNFEAGMSKLAFIAHDCAAAVALTTRRFLRSYQPLMDKRGIMSPWGTGPGLPKLEWVATDDVRGLAPAGFDNDPGPTLFLQYTSGSTSEPKGVIVSHENVIHNCGSMIDHVPIGVSWLPQYHDMGLIGYYLFPILAGGMTYGISPQSFLKRPALWLQMISRFKATCASAPNFGYEYCLREDKLPSGQLEGIDLGSVRVMMNAAEPVRPGTFSRFLKRFSPYGLRPEAYVVAYGLAENTLAVSNHGRRVVTVNKALLQKRSLHLENGPPRNNNQVQLVSCGRPVSGVDVQIVNPDTRASLGEGQIGEIWIAGPSRSAGYWNRPELSREVFGGTVSNRPGNRSAYLRSGDLGFSHEGELFVCGRIKDLVIIHGVNYYPQDIEAIVEACSPKIRKNGVVAFDVDDGTEALVVIAEIRSAAEQPDPAEVMRAIRTQYYVEPGTLVFVPHGTISRTTSGKLARSRNRERWLAGEMPVIASFTSKQRPEPGAEAGGLRGRFRYLLELYNLTGREEITFAEIGIDSLTLVELLEDIRQLLQEHGAGSLVNEVDVRLLQRLTVAGFFSLLDRFEKSSSEPLDALKEMLRRDQAEHEDYERDCMKSDALLDLPRLELPASPAAISNVLLTGASGFFGPFLLKSLLEATPYTYSILTRATDPVHGLDRIRAVLRRANLWTQAVEDQLGRRVRILCGDISRHNLGLPSEQWKALTTQVQAVCHNAALVNYVLNYDALRPHNVDGTRELLRFAATGVPKEFHLVSSTFIHGWTSKKTLLETDHNLEMMNLDFGYSQSKWVAEQLVYAAGKQGLKIRVYRPSLISASADGIGGRDDISIRLLSFMIQHGVAVNARNQISFLPVDIAAHNIAAIFSQRETRAETFHVTVDDYYNMMDVTRTITRDYGYPFTYYEIPEFVEQMNRRCTREDLLYPLVDFFNAAQDKVAAMQHKRYSNEEYRRARATTGKARPDPSLDQTVSWLVQYMLREGIIPERARPAATGGAGAPQRAKRNAR